MWLWPKSILGLVVEVRNNRKYVISIVHYNEIILYKEKTDVIYLISIANEFASGNDSRKKEFWNIYSRRFVIRVLLNGMISDMLLHFHKVILEVAMCYKR